MVALSLAWYISDMPSLSISFVHVPKTGGSWLWKNFDQENYGHKKVSEFKSDTQLATFIRDPYDARISEYYFCKSKSVPIPCSNYADNYELIKNGATLEEFLYGIKPNSLYTYFFDTVTPKDFTFVGVTSRMDDSVHIFEKIFHKNLIFSEGFMNESRQMGTCYKSHYSRKKFAKDNDEDYQLYKEGLQKFKRGYLPASISY
jgi:hypothetical protein